MGSICEMIITLFTVVFFGQKRSTNSLVERKDEYTLSSVFPSQNIMIEVKKYLNNDFAD